MVKTIQKTNKVASAGALALGTAVALASASVASAAGLTNTDASNIFAACKSTAAATPSAVGRASGTKMWCAVLDREGATLLIQATDTNESPGPNLTTDAWRASIEIAEAKAYTAVSLSSNENVFTSKTIGLLARTDVCLSPPCAAAAAGTDAGSAPLFGIGDTNPFRPPGGAPSLNPDDKAGSKHHGIVTFAGGQPVYSCSTHQLLGGVGVSGDGVDQDDTVAKGAVTGAGFCLSPNPGTSRKR
jgi:uncharacterized protein GlcG (DUF336 family)